MPDPWSALPQRIVQVMIMECSPLSPGENPAEYPRSAGVPVPERTSQRIQMNPAENPENPEHPGAPTPSELEFPSADRRVAIMTSVFDLASKCFVEGLGCSKMLEGSFGQLVDGFGTSGSRVQGSEGPP